MKLERKFCVQPAPSKILHILHMQAPPFLAPLFKVQSPIGPSTRWTGAVPTNQHPSPSHHCVPGPPPADDLKALEALPRIHPSPTYRPSLLASDFSSSLPPGYAVRQAFGRVTGPTDG